MNYIYKDKIIFYNKEGENHRLNGPAVIFEKYQTWWVEGKRHRIGGPAIINNYFQAWYQNGELHRLDGPAYIHNDNYKE